MTPAVQVVSYVTALDDLGYRFRLNEAGDVIEVNGKRLDDIELATIRARMRAEGYDPAAVEDVIKMQAGLNRYHPIRAYLTGAGMQWDGVSRIGDLAACFQDETRPHPMFAVWLRKWLIGAVAKAMDGRQNQNAMLVLDGPQGIGKSQFAHWLCSSLPDYFVESPIDPSSKDHQIRLTANWIWEVSELGATTRKADIEALKAFISQQTVTVRKPYGRLDIVKPALASFIGTINDSTGFLADSTGNRRFMVAHIGAIDWSYTQMDVNQIWGEAFNAYVTGEGWQLSRSERAMSEENNAAYRVPNVIEGYLSRYFEIDRNDTQSWMATSEIVARLQTMGFREGSSRSIAMQVAATLNELGLAKERRMINGCQAWGYVGIWAGLGTTP